MPKKGRKKKEELIDWNKDENFDKNRVIIHVEHSNECPVYKMRAEAFLEFLQEEIPEKMFALICNNYGKDEPRFGAFELKISQNARTSKHNLWSGIEKGPPRRDKFPPDFNELLPDVKRVLKKVYADKDALEMEDDDRPSDSGERGVQFEE